VEFIAQHADSLQECRDAASVILDNSDYLLRILDDLLEYNKPDDLSGNNIEKSTVQTQQMDVPCLVYGIHRLFSNTANRKKLFLTVSCDTLIPRIILTDAIRVRQILINLVSNAIKFTPSGGVRIILSWQKNNSPEISSATGTLKINVCDSGIGISPEVLADLPRLFLPYQQADQTIKQRFGGTGLGLAISKMMAERLGGKINVTNNPEGGTTFSLLLPIKLEGEIEFVSDLTGNITEQSKNIDTEKIDNDDNVASERVDGCRVLLVEDSEELRRLWNLFLTKAGAIVTHAENGKSAFDFASNENYDVILMDVNLPPEDGYSVVRKLRNNGYKGQIIAVTADNSLECKEKSQLAGCNSFVTKPLFHDELIKIVKEHSPK
jgi:CheY-like chemotaxis protein